MKLRIHHFFDIIRDIGRGIEFTPHPYGHANHKIAEMIRIGRDDKIELVMGCDDICTGCVHNIDSHCDDSILYNRFQGKEKYNEHIDTRIMEVCGLKIHDVITAEDLCRKGEIYANSMKQIYEYGDPEITKERKLNFKKGMKVFLSGKQE